ncbi:MAG: glycosyltransferase family 2 protein [Cyclobacteriaceae bacterium]|nr:glycosyltransferase family 2 protein [Cyclobacteriaceae bacterium]
MLNPFFSIIIPVYNNITYLSETINSVKNQVFQDWELILVDDASQDGVAEFLVQNYKDVAARILVNPSNKGPSATRNCGAQAAKGKYLLFLDADDLLLAHALADFHAFITKKNFPKVCWAKHLISLDAYQKKIKRGHSVFLAGSFVILRDFFFQIGGYDERLRVSENTDLFFNILIKNNLSPEKLNKAVLIYRKIVSAKPKYKSETILKSTFYFLKKYKIEHKKKANKAKANYFRILAFYLATKHPLFAKRFILQSISLNPFNIRSYYHFLKIEFSIVLHAKFKFLM